MADFAEYVTRPHRRWIPRIGERVVYITVHHDFETDIETQREQPGTVLDGPEGKFVMVSLDWGGWVYTSLENLAPIRVNSSGVRRSQ